MFVLLCGGGGGVVVWSACWGGGVVFGVVCQGWGVFRFGGFVFLFCSVRCAW